MDQMRACVGDETCEVSAKVRAAVESNYKVMVQVLRPGNKGARVFHNIGGGKANLPDHMDEEHEPGTPDQSILVWDGALSEDECHDIIELFEDSEHYTGNLVSNGKIVVGA
jgi:hypothetical protein